MHATSISNCDNDKSPVQPANETSQIEVKNILSKSRIIINNCSQSITITMIYNIICSSFHFQVFRHYATNNPGNTLNQTNSSTLHIGKLVDTEIGYDQLDTMIEVLQFKKLLASSSQKRYFSSSTFLIHYKSQSLSLTLRKLK